MFGGHGAAALAWKGHRSQRKGLLIHSCKERVLWANYTSGPGWVPESGMSQTQTLPSGVPRAPGLAAEGAGGEGRGQPSPGARRRSHADPSKHCFEAKRSQSRCSFLGNPPPLQNSNQQDPSPFRSSRNPTLIALPKACSLPTGRDLWVLLHDAFSA